MNNEITDVIKTVNTDLDTITGTVNTANDTITTLSDTVNDTIPAINNAADAVNDIAPQIREASKSLNEGIPKVNDMIDELSESVPKVNETVDQISSIDYASINQTAQNVEAATSHLEEVITQANEVLRNTNATVTDVNSTVTDLSNAVTDTTKAISSAMDTVNSFDVDGLNKSVSSLQDASRQVRRTGFRIRWILLTTTSSMTRSRSFRNPRRSSPKQLGRFPGGPRRYPKRAASLLRQARQLTAKQKQTTRQNPRRNNTEEVLLVRNII